MQSLLLASIGLLALASVGKSQQYCSYQGPQDAQTLQGTSFLTNSGTGECLTLSTNAQNYQVPISLNACQWNTARPALSQLYKFQNSGAGTVLQPASANAYGYCFDSNRGTLTSAFCSPKSDDQIFVFQRYLVPGARPGNNEFKIVQSSTGRCVAVNSGFGANNAVITECSQEDRLQVWKICTAPSQGQGIGQGSPVGSSGPSGPSGPVRDHGFTAYSTGTGNDQIN